jgi:integrase
MARSVRNAKLDTRSARTKLAAKREPYWTVITKGCALGYRKGAKAGTWISRFRDDAGKQHYQSIGAADDAMDPDGVVCLSYSDAQREAGKWFRVAANGFQEGEARSGPHTVKDAMADYLAAYIRRGGKALDRTQSAIEAHINPMLGNVPISKLTKRRVEQWHEKLSTTAPMIRTAQGAPKKHREADESSEGTRRRKSTANRILTVLKAALNHSYADGKVSSDEAWRNVKAYREVDAARVRYLNDEESRRLVNACAPDFRPMVQAALLTGCRYGEMAALKVTDYNTDAGTLHIRISKSGKPRHVVLTDEGRAFFDAVIVGKTGSTLIFTHPDGDAWGRSHQQRPFKAACKVAKVDPLTFHELRHSYASRLVMNGAPLAVIATQLGHKDTRMVEKHYGHLCPNFVADTVRAAFSSLGVVNENNVVSLK